MSPTAVTVSASPSLLHDDYVCARVKHAVMQRIVRDLGRLRVREPFEVSMRVADADADGLVLTIGGVDLPPSADLAMAAQALTGAPIAASGNAPAASQGVLHILTRRPGHVEEVLTEYLALLVASQAHRFVGMSDCLRYADESQLSVQQLQSVLRALVERAVALPERGALRKFRGMAPQDTVEWVYEDLRSDQIVVEVAEAGPAATIGLRRALEARLRSTFGLYSRVVEVRTGCDVPEHLIRVSANDQTTCLSLDLLQGTDSDSLAALIVDRLRPYMTRLLSLKDVYRVLGAVAYAYPVVVQTALRVETLPELARMLRRQVDEPLGLKGIVPSLERLIAQRVSA